jgi:hypothetical protein
VDCNKLLTDIDSQHTPEFISHVAYLHRKFEHLHLA